MTRGWLIPFSSVRRTAHLMPLTKVPQLVKTACGLPVNPAIAEMVPRAKRCTRCKARAKT